MKEVLKRIGTGIAVAVFVLIGVAQCVGDSVTLVPRALTGTTIATEIGEAYSTDIAQEAFLTTVREWSLSLERVTLVDVSTDADLVALALDTCRMFEQGITRPEAVDLVMATLDPEYWEDAAVIMGAAVGAYCPEYDN